MYVLIVSDAPALPVDLCIASAMLGHAAWAFRPEELHSGSGSRPELVLLDIEDSESLAGSVASVRKRHPEVPIALLTDGEPAPGVSDGPLYALSRPVTAAGLRDLILRASPVAA